MRIRRAVALLAATPVAVLGAGTPAAADTSADEAAGASLTMVMASADDSVSTGAGVNGDLPRKATLTCHPAGGTHPTPKESCDILTEVGGDFEALPVEPGVCIQVWDPVTVTVRGHWFGAPVEFEETYSNSGCAAAGSDGIFAF